MEHYGLSHSTATKKFSEYPQEFATRITALIKESFASCDDPLAFSVLAVSFISGSGILSHDHVDSDTAEVLKVECTDAYVSACAARSPSENSVFLKTFDAFASQARSLVPVFSTDSPIQAKKCQFFEKHLFRCAVDFLDSLMLRMKRDSILCELVTVIKFVFPLCANLDLCDEIKTSKLKPAMKILRTCLFKSEAAQSSQASERICNCLLSALVSHTRDNSDSNHESYDFKCTLLSHANQWMSIARTCALNLYNDDEEFQPKVFQSTHPYADNRKTPLPTPHPPHLLTSSPTPFTPLALLSTHPISPL